MIKQILFLLSLFLIANQVEGQLNTASKQMSTFIIDAPQLHTTKKIWIYKPKNYDQTSKKYSVLYMHDAQNLFDSKSSYAGEWNVDEKLDSLQDQVIVVGIEHGNEKRMEELTPFKNDEYGGGKADDYLDFIVKTLKPKIDSTYRTKSTAKNTLIMGSSLGGLVSFYAVLKYPKVFGKAGVFSPSFWFSNEIYKYAQSQNKIKSKIYFMCGDNESTDMVTDLNKMETLLNSKRCSCLHLNQKKIIKGGQHNEKLWRDGFVEAIQWLKF
jgi:alpha-glucosidase